MTKYNPTTGHITSPQRNWGEVSNSQHEYVVNCDDRVSYRVIASDAWTAERKARALYWHDAGVDAISVTARW